MSISTFTELQNNEGRDNEKLRHKINPRKPSYTGTLTGKKNFAKKSLHRENYSVKSAVPRKLLRSLSLPATKSLIVNSLNRDSSLSGPFAFSIL